MAKPGASNAQTRVRFPPPALTTSGVFGTFSVVKTEERIKARAMRAHEGESIKVIAGRLGVAPSSVSLWVRDIVLTEEQRERLRRRNSAFNGQCIAAERRSARARERRRAEQASGRDIARREDPLHIAGCMLFWAEGSRARNAVIFVNSDPEMMRFFIRFLRECYDVSATKCRVTCNLFADHRSKQQRIEDFWLEALELPRACLRPSIVNVYSKHSQKKRRNKLAFGTCRLVVHDTALVQSLYGAIQEYAGFDRPEWLG
jgi:transposase-like protein